MELSSLELTVTQSHVDRFNHVASANYLLWYKDGINLFPVKPEMALPHAQESIGDTAVIRRVELDYMNQLFVGDKITIYTAIDKVGTTNITYQQRIERYGDIISKARIVMGFTPGTHGTQDVPSDLYLAQFKKAQVGFLHAIGISFQMLEQAYGVRYFVKCARFDYAFPKVLPGEEPNMLSVPTAITQIGTTSMSYLQAIWRGDLVIARAKTVAVFVDAEGEKTAIPENLREKLAMVRATFVPVDVENPITSYKR